MGGGRQGVQVSVLGSREVPGLGNFWKGSSRTITDFVSCWVAHIRSLLSVLWYYSVLPEQSLGSNTAYRDCPAAAGSLLPTSNSAPPPFFSSLPLPITASNSGTSAGLIRPQITFTTDGERRVNCEHFQTALHHRKSTTNDSCKSPNRALLGFRRSSPGDGAGYEGMWRGCG